MTSTSSTSRSVRSLANDSSSVAMPFIGASALAIATMRPGTRGFVGGTNTSSFTPSGMTSMFASSTPKSLTMPRRLDSETVRTLPTRARDLLLHPQEAVPAAQRRASCGTSGAAEMSMRRSKVIGWWMVVTSGRPIFSDVEHPVAQHLVVVDDVEVVTPGLQQPCHRAC